MERKSLRDISLEYNQQFKENMKTAKFLVKHIRDPKEQQLATKWLSRVSNIKSSALDVKKNRNAFLAYLIKVLRNQVRSEYLRSEPGIDPDYINSQDEFLEIPADGEGNPECRGEIQFHSKWSEDHRTYVAVQPIPGRGALVYMAVSKEPGIKNWDLPSLKKSQI